MLQSIEERMEDQLIEKESKRFIYKGFGEKMYVQDNTLNHNIEVDWDKIRIPANWESKVNNHYDEPGQYTNEDFETQANELYLRKLKAEFESRELKTWLRSLILQTPNDQELGAAIREWYDKTEGKFI